MERIGFGGSCHWCTEAIFRSLIGVEKVEQGWIAPDGDTGAYSEAVIVYFNAEAISLATLIAVHLHTHSCTSAHTMRDKYRSAVYVFDSAQAVAATNAIHDLHADFNAPIITQILPFLKFKLNSEQYLDYYYRDPEKPFCRNIVSPKLSLLMKKFGKYVVPGRIPDAGY